MFKLVLVLMLVAVVASLFSGLFFLYRDKGSGERTIKALTLRIALSMAAFVLALLGHYLGWFSN